MSGAPRLGFRAFDPHELLCHFLALDGGLYEQPVGLHDLTFAPEGSLGGEAVQVACGAAALAAEPFRIVLIAATRPHFWLVAREGMALEDVRAERVAGYPSFAPPARFLAAVLGDGAAAVRDDDARIGLLLAGEVDAALVSSGSPLPRLARIGLEPLLFLGDRLPLPTTGLAALGAPPWLPRVVEAHRRALAILRHDRAAVQETLRLRFRYDEAEAEWFSQLAASTFSLDGEPAGDVRALYRELLSE